MDIFYSARVKLTTFYFLVLLVFCLLLTVGVWVFTNYELGRGYDAQRGAVHRLIERYYYDDSSSDTTFIPGEDRYFTNAQQQQAAITNRRLNRDFLLTDMLLLMIGAVLSYWYAGRTLKPIEEAHEQQKRFTSDASHELRTPLASMRLENEVFLRQKYFAESEARELITSNLEEVERLERLATNLLALSQYEQGDITKTAVPAKAIVQDALDRTKRQSGKENRPKFTVKIAPAKLQVNRESLTELMSILLDNAVKYGPPKGEIVIGGEKRDGGYIFAVRDHGPGVSAHDMPHIFDRMYRGDKARSSQVSGHGIGLSLAKQIADVHGAELAVMNHPEGGALFTLLLP